MMIGNRMINNQHDDNQRLFWDQQQQIIINNYRDSARERNKNNKDNKFKAFQGPSHSLN